MDNQKTGGLIAQRRNELGLTQKQLAEQLHLSDRTVSRWERGVGFPEISLLEPLADALGLSVLELLRGERMEVPHEAAEDTVRDAARTFGTRFKTSMKRLRWALAALAVVAALFLCGVLRLWSLGYLERWAHSEEISASEALAVCSFALITMEEFETVQMVLQDEALTSHLPAVYDKNHVYSLEDLFEADESILSRYEGMLQIDGEPARITSILVTYAAIYIDYRAGDRRCMLTIFPFDDIVDKTCTQYDLNSDYIDPLFIISNRDNRSFSMLTESSKLSMMLSN